MTTLTAADYADTGQWRLILRIAPTWISAFLENTVHDDVPPSELFTGRWEDNPDTLLQNIENAVYDNPRVLDDFSARIEIFATRTLFIPTAMIEDQEDVEEALYNAVYSSKPEDIMYGVDRDITAAYSLTPGLKGFLNRTFPGARVENNLMRQVRLYRQQGEGRRLFITVRDKEADFILLEGNGLMSASTHGWAAGADIVYLALNLLDVYGVSIKECIVNLLGDNIPAEARDAFIKLKS